SLGRQTGIAVRHARYASVYRRQASRQLSNVFQVSQRLRRGTGALANRLTWRGKRKTGCGGNEGEPVAHNVFKPAGREADLAEHLSTEHRKGNRGFTDEYLATLHQTLHQRKRDPLPGHNLPEDEMPAALV